MSDLFTEARIGEVRLPNRFVRSATAEGMSDNWDVSDNLVSLYQKLAEGGVGLITTGMSHVSSKGQALVNMLGFESDSRLPGLKRLTKRVHDSGAKIAAQLAHAGPNRYMDPGFPAEGPSAVAHRSTQVVPEEMTKADIKQLVSDFSAAAGLAAEAGFDMVQVHAAHEYLLSLFLSPFANQRSDEYGGSIENRARIVLEVYKAVQGAVGTKCAVTAKIDAKQFYDIGLDFDESSWVCRELSAMGIDAIELSAIGGTDEFLGMFTGPNEPAKEAYLESYARKLKPQIQCPLILVGGLRSLEVMERLYKDGVADFFSMSRPLVSEPGLIGRWQTGDRKKARCISCTKCLFGVLGGGELKCHQFNGDTEE